MLDVSCSPTSASPRLVYSFPDDYREANVVFQTKGLSLEQVDLLYQNTTPMRSVAYRAQLKRDGVELSADGAHIKHDSTSEHEKV